MKRFMITAAFAAGVTLGIFPATAQDLVYRPMNPSFGGSPLNSAHLLGTAGAQRTATARDAPDDDAAESPAIGGTGNTPADQFVRQLQSRLLSALAAQVTDAIFGDNPQDSGTVQFGDTTVTFDRSLEGIRLVIFNALDGTTTEIFVPQLVAADGVDLATGIVTGTGLEGGLGATQATGFEQPIGGGSLSGGPLMSGSLMPGIGN